jgi:hypothetical protein
MVEGRPGSGDRIARGEGGNPVLLSGCGPGCSHCGAVARRGSTVLAGDSMAGRAIGCFLVPLALTLAGALVGSAPVGQFLGAVIGLVGGMVVAVVAVRHLRPG